MREAGEVLYNVKEALFREDSFKECVVIDLLLAFIVSILGLPFHEAVFAAGDCTSLRTQHVAHHTEGIVCEHRRDLEHVVSDLSVGGRSVSLFS